MCMCVKNMNIKERGNILFLMEYYVWIKLHFWKKAILLSYINLINSGIEGYLEWFLQLSVEKNKVHVTVILIINVYNVHNCIVYVHIYIITYIFFIYYMYNN